MKQVEELKKKVKEAEEKQKQKQVAEKVNKQLKGGWEGARGSKYMLRGSGAKWLAGKAMSSAMHVELQARMVATKV